MSDTYLIPTDAPAQEGYNFSEHRVPRILETDLVNETNANKQAQVLLDKAQYLYDALIALKKLYEVIFSVGDYKRSEQAANHNGWLLCNGAAISRTKYADLFALTSTDFGVGDGSTTFNLPDFRGRFALAAGQGGGLTNRTKGQKGGAEKHTLNTNELPSHSHSCNWAGDHRHSIYDNGHTHWFDVRHQQGGAGWNGGRPHGTDRPANTGHNTNNAYTGITMTNAGNHTHTINNTGGGQSHNNMPPFLVAGNIFIYSGVLN